MITRRGLFRLLAGIAAKVALPALGSGPEFLSVVPEVSYRFVFSSGPAPDGTARVRIVAPVFIGQWAEAYPKSTLLEGKNAVVVADL